MRKWLPQGIRGPYCTHACTSHTQSPGPVLTINILPASSGESSASQLRGGSQALDLDAALAVLLLKIIACLPYPGMYTILATYLFTLCNRVTWGTGGNGLMGSMGIVTHRGGRCGTRGSRDADGWPQARSFVYFSLKNCSCIMVQSCSTALRSINLLSA